MREKIIVLVPLQFNDGTRVPRKAINDFLTEIFVLAGGYNIAGHGKGAYRMASGQKQVDANMEVWIALDATLVDELRVLVRKYCGILGQEAMYFEKTGARVDFVEPDDGGSHEEDE